MERIELTHRICVECNTDRPITDFARNRQVKSGYRVMCKYCVSAKYHGKEWKEKFNPYKDVPENTKACTKCKNIRSLDEYSVCSAKYDGLATECKYCESMRKYNVEFTGNKPYREAVEYEDDTKYCPSCKTIKPIDEFRDKPKYFEQRSANKKRSECSYCEGTRSVANRFKISVEKYKEMRLVQGDNCFICGKSEAENRKRLALDHDHKTGKLRKFLCQYCNTSLGLMQDSPELLLKAAEYLKSHQEPILSNQINTLIPII